jgi:hypothetical protein
MPTTKLNLTSSDLAAPFAGDWAERYPPILSRRQVAGLLGLSVKTIDDWLSKGRLDGTFRKRGKHLFFWRDRLLENVFNGKEWR